MSLQRVACAAARPARRPNTVQSSSELPIIRFRPCTPPVISPAAYRPAIGRPLRRTAASPSTSTPPWVWNSAPSTFARPYGGSNGASQAILDARCLADRLVSAEHPVHALWQYEQERLPPTAQIVKMNRGGGPEGVIDAVEQRAPDGFSNIDDVLPFEQRKAIVRGYAGVAGFAQSQVNTQVNTAAGKAA